MRDNKGLSLHKRVLTMVWGPGNLDNEYHFIQMLKI